MVALTALTALIAGGTAASIVIATAVSLIETHREVARACASRRRPVTR